MKIHKLTVTEDDLNILCATLLTAKEAEKLPVELREYSRWWWLKSPGYNQSYVMSVRCSGSIDHDGDSVDYDADAVRPALRIDMQSSNLKIGDKFIFGNKTFQIVSSKYAFCTEDIGECAFRDDYKAEDATDYEKSDVKKLVDGWFKKAEENAK